MRRARRRRRGSAAAVAFTVAAAVPLLGGCGIQETDVIAAGGPASFQAFLNREYDMLLFFRSPDGGLSPVIRTVTRPPADFGYSYESGSADQIPDDTAGPIPTEKIVTALLAGPREEDRAAGLETSSPLPAPAGPSRSSPSRAAGSGPACPLPLRDWTARPYVS